MKYNAKRVVTSADLFDACDPPLKFEVRTRPSTSWAKQNNLFEEEGSDNPELAAKLISMAFFSISDEDETLKLDTLESVQIVRDIIESGNPGYGDNFLCNIAWGFSQNHYSFLERNLGKSRKSLPPSKGTVE